MARGQNQKEKLYRLIQILKSTDEKHGITMAEVIEKMNAYGVDASRKSIYEDIKTINDMMDCDYEIGTYRDGARTRYYMVGRPFDLAEVKLLADAVAASKFITVRKTYELIEKLKTLVSKADGVTLERSGLEVDGKRHSQNTSGIYSLDNLFKAIRENRKVSFKYFGWDVDKSMKFHRDDGLYTVSPWKVLIDDGYYYLVGFDEGAGEAGEIRNYRVDKMVNVRTKEGPRIGEELFKKERPDDYTTVHFDMFGGEVESVKLLCKNEMSNVIVDRFGNEVTMMPAGQDKFTVVVNVSPSERFISWISSFEDSIKIVGPESVVQKMKEHVKKLSEVYS